MAEIRIERRWQKLTLPRLGSSVRITSPRSSFLPGNQKSASRGSPRLFGFWGSTKLADSEPFILESPHIPCWREGGSRGMASLYLVIGSQGSARELKPAHPIVQCRFVPNKHADRQPFFLKEHGCSLCAADSSGGRYYCASFGLSTSFSTSRRSSEGIVCPATTRERSV